MDVNLKSNPENIRISQRWLRRCAGAFFALLALVLLINVASFGLNNSDDDWVVLSSAAKQSPREFSHTITGLAQKNMHVWRDVAGTVRGLRMRYSSNYGPNIKPGCDGWLFLGDEFDERGKDVANGLLRIDILKAVAQELKQKQVRFQIVVVPDKSRIEQQHLCGQKRPDSFLLRKDRWISAAHQAGLSVLDFSEVLAKTPQDSFYQTDSHWNEIGAASAANELARVLNLKSTVQLPSVATVHQERLGDLLKIAGVNELPRFLRPATEIVQFSQIPPVPSAGSDLFDAAGLPDTVLIGTSFSLRGNFLGFLEYATGRQIANVAVDGGDFDQSGRQYFMSQAWHEQTPKIVIWEVPERMLEIPFKAREQAWLQTLTSRK
ncbi:alginate O-acetyltransferase AlgX-related protein [Undibacterium sp. SXout11W]|uniref:alginate O-acetyltransferase AlgX-related protein n=1 Tax=Undibacterium sp. SXout11W TaxID=3413050 RepID=UPI003BEF4F04